MVISVRKSESPNSNTLLFLKLRGDFVRIRSIHQFSVFLKYVFCFAKSFRLYVLLKSEIYLSVTSTLTPIQDVIFRGYSRMGGAVTHPTMMKLGTVIPYLRKIKKIYKSRDTPLQFCWHQHFSPETSSFCYIKKYR